MNRKLITRRALGRSWLLVPVGLLYGGLTLLPLALIARYSLTDGGVHYATVLHSRLLLRVVQNTVAISLTTTVVALVLGYLLAAALWRATRARRNLLLAVILLPFWTAVLIKNFAWASLLQDNGAINSVLLTLGITNAPITLLHNRLAVIIGMVHYVLPYAVFPIYTSMQAIDRRIEHAARSLGAATPSVLWRIIFPLTLPGITSAGLLVFIVSCGFFITTVILGAPSDMMMANLVDYYVHVVVDFGTASALAVLILLAVLPLIVVQQLLPKEGVHGAT
jgi:ABC-type spermidine/putrescine transport system permease subunit I